MHAALPLGSSALYFAAMWRSVAGSKATVSMPLTMPWRSAPPLAQQSLQAFAELVGEDLLRVALAHGAHDVGADDRTRHRVRLARVLDGQTRAWQTDQREHALVGAPLIREVVDREHRRGRGESARPRDERNEECRVPVVRVDDIGW